MNDEKKVKILEFHKLRNEIQHRALNFLVVKKQAINDTRSVFEEFYQNMFPKFADSFPDLIFY